MNSKRIGCLCPLAVFLLLAADSPDRLGSQEALSPLQSYVGSWRGVGQVRRGSSQGAWIEQSDWIWKFTADEAALQFISPKAKYFTAGTLHWTGKPGQFRLDATTADGQDKASYSGSLDDDGQLLLVADHQAPAAAGRISIRLVAEGKRLVVLYERKTAGDRFARLAEVGYTREGSNFGKGTGFVECVVTGGQGTIPVTHDGKTYYVCCSGCKDLFNEDPAGVLAEYRERKEAEREKSQ